MSFPPTSAPDSLSLPLVTKQRISQTQLQVVHTSARQMAEAYSSVQLYAMLIPPSMEFDNTYRQIYRKKFKIFVYLSHIKTIFVYKKRLKVFAT